MHCNGKSSGNCPFGFSGRVRNTSSGEAILVSSTGGCGASDAKAFPKESDEIATPYAYSLVGIPLRVPETAFVILLIETYSFFLSIALIKPGFAVTLVCVSVRFLQI